MPAGAHEVPLTHASGWARSLPLPAPSMGTISSACEHTMSCMGSAYCLARGSRSHALLAQRACQQRDPCCPCAGKSGDGSRVFLNLKAQSGVVLCSCPRGFLYSNKLRSSTLETFYSSIFLPHAGIEAE